MQSLDELTAQRELLNAQAPYSFPATPFENIGFALSGGGFRAALYGLGVLSLLDRLTLEDGDTLLQKVRFVSSASGGTLVLAPYLASLHQGLSFDEFYAHVRQQTTGENVLRKAIALLDNEAGWEEGGKSRNIINAFAKAYDDCLFSFIPEKQNRILGFLMPENGKPVHLQEFCFNATEFYTGISFRFQGGDAQTGLGSAPFGNANIKVTRAGGAFHKASETLKKIRLGDVAAASSCFPLGFEPIVYPNDFTSAGGCTAQELKEALTLLMHSWDDGLAHDENVKSSRAQEEHDFASKKEFSLMDGGICDNQGLYSLLLANGRLGNNEKATNRFDLMMVSDVTSHFMKPYKPPSLKRQGTGLQKPLGRYWDGLRSFYQKVQTIYSWSWIVVAGLLLVAALPFALEGPSVAAWMLAVLCLLLLGGVFFLRRAVGRAKGKFPLVQKIFAAESIKELLSTFLPKNSFAARTANGVADFVSEAPVGVLVKMLGDRALSTASMVGDVFLKQVRRLIYDFLFKDARYTYRRLSNPIYKLTFSNRKRPDNPEFEPQEHEDDSSYEQRKAAFQSAVKDACIVSDAMRTVAEKAYSVGTTLWLEEGGANKPEAVQEALLATGQFTVCHSLLAYTLRLKHSRHFAGQSESSRNRILSLEPQLKTFMLAFARDPYHLCKQTPENGPAAPASEPNTGGGTVPHLA